ncbi:MAG TPA: DUF4332 domain-containing protein [Methanothrix sp.]|nr:DUF4332 domain-containing protein [Methanothrix sp.]
MHEQLTSGGLLTKVLSIQRVKTKHPEKLASAGINPLEKLLEAGSTKDGRAEISEKTGIEESLILQWVNLADLFRVKGIGEKYSDLLEAAGVDTVVELSKRVPESLYAKLLEVNGARKIAGRDPTLPEVRSWIEKAKKMPRIIQY